MGNSGSFRNFLNCFRKISPRLVNYFQNVLENSIADRRVALRAVQKHHFRQISSRPISRYGHFFETYPTLKTVPRLGHYLVTRGRTGGPGFFGLKPHYPHRAGEIENLRRLNLFGKILYLYIPYLLFTTTLRM